jgi:hypothetical protein
METPVVVALIAGAVTAVGWMANHIFAGRQERAKQKKEASLKHVERQLEELSGPLAFLMYEGRRTFLDLLDTLGRDYVFKEGEPLLEDELRTWLFWAEYSLIPKNEKIKNLLMSKTHLIEGPRFPESYVAFLDHHNSWAVKHERWKQEQVEYSWQSKIGWPESFEKEVISTFESLKAKHAALLGELTYGK